MMKLKDLHLPKGLNLDFLLNFLSEEELMAVIGDYADKPRKERKIILPSRTCLRKCLAYYLVEKHEGDFDAVMDILRGEEKILGNALLHKGNIKKLYEQRKKEIVKEIENEK